MSLSTRVLLPAVLLAFPANGVADTWRVRADTANVRTAPSLQSGIAVAVGVGTLVDVIRWMGIPGRSWAEVAVPEKDTQGFIYGSLLEPATSIDGVASTKHADPILPELKAGSQARVVGRSVGLRTQPSATSPSVWLIPEGSVVDILDVTTAPWLKVRATSGVHGYLDRASVTAVEAPAMTDRVSVANRHNGDTAPRRPVVATTPADPPVRRPAATPERGDDSPRPRPQQAGSWGLGAALVSLGGGMPSIQLDAGRSLTFRGLATIGTGAYLLGGEALFRLPPHEKTTKSVNVEPYLGGGIFVITVDYGRLFGRESFTGLLGSGGMFFTFRSNPHWRPYAEFTLLSFGVGDFGDPALRGVGVTVGFHYYF